MGRLTVTVAIAVAVVGLAYMMYTPFPDNFRRPGIGHVMSVSAKLVPFISKVLATVGIGEYFSNMRGIFYFFMTLGPRTFETVEIKRDKMDGVEVLLFTPTTPSDGLRPGMVFVHGGGWVLMDPDIYIGICREIAEQTQGVVMSPHYRRAPEHVFPVPLDDTVKATSHFLRNAAVYGVDSQKVGIAGDSAGGNLAIATALKLSMDKDPDLPPLRYQGLAYPCLQALDFSLPSFQKYMWGPGFVRKITMVTYWQYYLFGDDLSRHEQMMANMHTTPAIKKSKYSSYVNRSMLQDFIQKEIIPHSNDFGNETLFNEIQEKILNPLVAPLMASDEQLSKLPPTYMIIAEVDVLRDEGFILASRLKKANVRTEVAYYPNDQHGLITLVEIDELARDSIKLFVKFVNETLTKHDN